MTLEEMAAAIVGNRVDSTGGIYDRALRYLREVADGRYDPMQRLHETHARSCEARFQRNELYDGLGR